MIRKAKAPRPLDMLEDLGHSSRMFFRQIMGMVRHFLSSIFVISGDVMLTSQWRLPTASRNPSMHPSSLLASPGVRQTSSGNEMFRSSVKMFDQLADTCRLNDI